MEWVENTWNVFVESFFISMDPHTVFATLLFAIPALIVGWLMIYFER
ncbi:MAG: hypothetical protein AB7E49_07430 [Campylobacterales bacterium]